MLSDLHKYNIAYKSVKSVYRLIIDKNTSELNIKRYLNVIVYEFHSMKYVKSNNHQKLCDDFGIHNLHNPKYHHLRIRKSKYYDDQMKELIKQQNLKYAQSEKDKKSQYNRNKLYRENILIIGP